MDPISWSAATETSTTKGSMHLDTTGSVRGNDLGKCAELLRSCRAERKRWALYSSKWQGKVKLRAVIFHIELNLVATYILVHVQGITNPFKKIQFNPVLGGHYKEYQDGIFVRVLQRNSQ